MNPYLDGVMHCDTNMGTGTSGVLTLSTSGTDLSLLENGVIIDTVDIETAILSVIAPATNLTDAFGNPI